MANAGAFESKGQDFCCVMGPDVEFLKRRGYLRHSLHDRTDFHMLTERAAELLLFPMCLASPKKLSDFKRDVSRDKLTTIELLFQLQLTGWKHKPKPEKKATVAPRTKKNAKVFYLEEERPPFRSYLQALMRSSEFPEVHHFQLDTLPGSNSLGSALGSS